MSSVSVDDLRAAFAEIHEWAVAHPDHGEAELMNVVIESGLLDALGYKELGTDYRIDRSTSDSAKRPDIRCLDRATGEVTFVIELKTSGRNEDLNSHRGQLTNRYMLPLRSDSGLLLDGNELVFYERVSRTACDREFRSGIADLSESHARTIVERVGADAETYATVDAVGNYFDRYAAAEERLDLTEPESRANFYDDFSIRSDSRFRELVKTVVDLFTYMREDSEFTASAYDFWQKSYARETKKSEAPDWWRDIVDETDLAWSARGIRQFMFCLETSYALFSRLVLGKACADHEVPGVGFGEEIFADIEDAARAEEVPLNGWPLVMRRLIESMRRTLIEGVFEEDIFYWWTDNLDVFEDDIDRLWSESGRLGEVNEALSPFGEAVRDVTLSLYKYDFKRLASQPGDPLGDLYQNYFDRSTRKALGEFYTPQPVVEYMLDGIEYGGEGITDSRLIDPACGSGTFIVSALERYLAANERRAEREGWSPIIEELCNEFKIVGFDIHPFAVLMSQVQFMLVLIPKYKEAMQETARDFSPARLPIFRTDSLEQIGQTKFSGSTQVMPVEMRLPVENDDGEKIQVTLDFPHHSEVLSASASGLDIYNIEQYFLAVQAVFSVVKEQAELADAGMGAYEIDRADLKTALGRYLDGNRDYRRIAEFFKSTMADGLMDDIEMLVTQYDDGRLVKSIEDNVIATLLKNPEYVKFDRVIANPPYVDNQGQETFKQQKDDIEDVFGQTTGYGEWDLYCPFMQKGIQWLSEGGQFAYITPNQYMRTMYGRGVREYILSETDIRQIVDFRDAGVFADVLNYPCITILEKSDPEREGVSDATFSFARVASATGDEPVDGAGAGDGTGDTSAVASPRVAGSSETVDDGDGGAASEPGEMGDRVGSDLLDTIRTHLGEEYSDECVDTYTHAQADLDRGFWTIMPADEQAVFDDMVDAGPLRIGNVTDEGGSFQGLRTGLNGVFVVTLPHREMVTADDGGETVAVRPSGDDYPGTYDIETDLLRPFLAGREVGRWTLKGWSGKHVIVPYNISEEDDGTLSVDPYSTEQMERDYPDTLDYLGEWRELSDGRSDLAGRDGGDMAGQDSWYLWSRNQNIDKFEREKLMNVEISAHPQFMPDSEGQWYTTSAYGMIVNREYRESVPHITALFNSTVLDYCLKHISTMKDGHHYKYATQYLDRLPLKLPEEGDERRRRIGEAVAAIEDRTELESRVESFPAEYIREYRDAGNPVDRKRVVSDAAHRDMDPEITAVDATTFHVTVGSRSKEEPIVVNTRAKAEYVRRSLAGSDVERDGELSVLVPRSSADAEGLLNDHDADAEALRDGDDIDEAEAAIDEAVFDLYFDGLEADRRDHHRRVMDRFLDRF